VFDAEVVQALIAVAARAAARMPAERLIFSTFVSFAWPARELRVLGGIDLDRS
jgi:hypothetical protein